MRRLVTGILCALVLCTAASPALAAVPTTLAVEGALTSAGGGPVTDGTYPLTFTLYESATSKAVLWVEGPANIPVKAGRFAYVLGASKPLTAATLTKAKAAWLEVTVATNPPLPRKQLHATAYALAAAEAAKLACTGCVSGSQLANGGISAAKVGFNFAASKTKGGPALDLACTGCVSVSELKFDGDLDLGGNSLKAKNGTFSGDVAAATVTANSFVGDGSKLSGIQTPAGTCKTAGEVVKGINADGSLQCVKAMDPSALPKDGLNEISNDLLSNQFIDTVASTKKKIPIPDNTGANANSLIQFPDIGTSQAFSISVHVENTDLSKVAMQVLPPDDKKTGWVLCDPCGKKDEKVFKKTYSPQAKPKSGDIAKWVGANPKGLWNLSVQDTSFCVPQAPGNKVYCNTTAKTDGWIADWSVQIQTLSNKKVEAKGLLVASGGLQLKQANSHPVTCTPERFGYLYANPKDKAVYVCNGEDFALISIFTKGTQNNPGQSCKDIKTHSPGSKSGKYWIDPDGAGGEAAFETWCDQETDGGGWTLAIRGTLNSSYNKSLNQNLSATKGFLKSYNRLKFTDILVRPGNHELTTHWALFAKVGNGTQTLDQKVKAGGSGSYGVDYNVDPPHNVTKRSASLAGVNEWEALSLRMSQTSGPNDAMFFVVARKNRASCNYYNGKRYTNTNCIGAQLGFGVSFYTWSNWQTWTGWQTGCGYAGYWNGSTTGCQTTGGVFVR